MLTWPRALEINVGKTQHDTMYLFLLVAFSCILQEREDSEKELARLQTKNKKE